jgi:hypothetical protein
MVFWFVFASGFTRRLLWFCAATVGIYLFSTTYIVVIVGSELLQSDHWQQWWSMIQHQSTNDTRGTMILMLLIFPQLALGISGFELCMTTTPLISGEPGNEVQQRNKRIWRARLMMLCLTLIMAVFLLATTLICTLQIPADKFASESMARHRALAFLAHGPLFPAWFGTAYDIITAVILCLAGVSVTIGLRDLVPAYLHRLGMELTWARKYGLFLLLCNVIILLATLVFRASVDAQEGAYATSVLVLLAGANLAAAADLRRRLPSVWFIIGSPFLVGLVFFLTMGLLMVWKQPGGLILSSAFLLLVFLTSSWSRWKRSMELRFAGFRFADSHTEKRWAEMVEMEYQILAPHRPGHFSVSKKDVEIRQLFRIPDEVPIIFIESELGDTSEFEHAPLMQIVVEYDLEIIKVSQCSSVAHVLAAVALEFSKTGRPPEVIFGWSHESPLAANLNFLLLGQGNIPWLVQELVRKAQPEVAKRPRVVIG